ncbi:NUDIX domain-containing protein [Spirochaetota bacterium]
METTGIVRVRVAGILINDDKLLLISHKKDGDVYWLLPGGGVNFGESLEEGLKREFLEELNIHVQVHDVALINDSIAPSGERHIINICFNCSYTGGEYTVGNEERLQKYDFFSRDDLESIKVYPPVNSHLVKAMDNENENKYIGKIWLDK